MNAALAPPIQRVKFGIQEVALAVSAAALACVLIAYGYLGLFTRYVADDFCAGRNLEIRGFWGSQIWTYVNHSGRFFSYFTRIGAAWVGQGHESSLAPAFFLICWLGTATWALFQLATLLKWQRSLLSSFLLAELVLFAMLRTAPDTGQSFYWQAGSFTYTVPIILMTAYLGMLLSVLGRDRNSSSIRSVIVVGGLAFFAGGCSETNAVFQCAGLSIAIIFCRWSSIANARRGLPILYSGLLGSILASLIVVAAPGNAVREAGVRSSHPALSFKMVLLKTLSATLLYVSDFLHDRTIAALALFLVPLTLAWLYSKNDRTQANLLLKIAPIAWAFAFLLIFSAIFPGMYALSSLPPARALFLDHLVLLTTLVLSGMAVGLATRHWVLESHAIWRVAGAVCITVLVLPWAGRTIRNQVASIRSLHTYAIEWDSEDSQIRRSKAVGASEIVLPWNASVASGGNVDGIEWLSSDPNYWINKCTSDYYGVSSLRTPGSESSRTVPATMQTSP